jgi:pyroglutamyl-peptidase
MNASPTRTVLLTGFDPFGGEHVNPSWDAVRRLQGAVVAGHRIETAQLPTAFGRGAHALLDALERHRPTLTLCVGQAGGRAGLSIERVAINLIDARIADNDGAQPIDLACVAGAPNAYFSSAPIKAMRAALQAVGIPAEISHTAGSFVCNHVFYVLMHALAADTGGARGGFVHVPYLPEQAQRVGDTPSMPLVTMTEGLRVAIDAALRHRHDLTVSAGITH